MKFFLCLLSTLSFAASAACPPLLAVPRRLDAAQTFENLSDAIYQDLIVKRGAPGLVVGISGTDSILVFLAGAKAFARAGRPERMVGIHFASELPQGLSDSVTRAAHWFELEVLPWLKTQAPGAQIIVDRSINHKRDGLRWGALLEWSTIADFETSEMRSPHDQFWVLGTRNLTETRLRTYSNASTAVSSQPIENIWKSEVLGICAHLGVPKTALEKSCDADCTCGRDQLPAVNIPEVDALLMVRDQTLAPAYISRAMPASLAKQLTTYISEQVLNGQFKVEIPYPGQKIAAVAKSSVDKKDLLAARRAILQEAADPRVITKILPGLIAEHDHDLAADLIGAADQVSARWVPEALMLYNVPGLRVSQLRQMHEKIFGAPNLNLAQVKRLAQLSARLAHYGFNFPAWRYLAKRFADSPSLAEQFGFIRLPKGFMIKTGEYLVEYRQEMILITRRGDAPVYLQIRNSSFHYGRSELPHAVEFAFEDQNQPWTEIVNAPESLALNVRLSRIDAALNALDQVNIDFNRWLKTEGRKNLGAFLRTYLNGRKIYVGTIRGSQAPWFPTQIRLMTRPEIDRLEQTPADPDDQARLTLFSGEAGDFPY